MGILSPPQYPIMIYVDKMELYIDIGFDDKQYIKEHSRICNTNKNKPDFNDVSKLVVR